MTAKNSATGKIIKPAYGEKITVNADNPLQVPNQPIIPFIEGDGIGTDNGAMIAMAAAMRLQAGVQSADARYSFDVKPRWPLHELV